MSINDPVIDEQDDGIYMYFHDLPPVLSKLKIKYPPPMEEEDEEL